MAITATEWLLTPVGGITGHELTIDTEDGPPRGQGAHSEIADQPYGTRF